MYSRRFLVDKLLSMINNMTLSYKVEEREREGERERKKIRLEYYGYFLKRHIRLVEGRLISSSTQSL